MLKYLTHKLKTQSINEENSNEKVSWFFRELLDDIFPASKEFTSVLSRHENFPSPPQWHFYFPHVCMFRENFLCKEFLEKKINRPRERAQQWHNRLNVCGRRNKEILSLSLSFLDFAFSSFSEHWKWKDMNVASSTILRLGVCRLFFNGSLKVTNGSNKKIRASFSKRKKKNWKNYSPRIQLTFLSVVSCFCYFDSVLSWLISAVDGN